MTMKEVLMAEDDGFPLFLVERMENGYGDCAFNFVVYEVVSWDMDGKPGDIEKYMSGYIKWDGCSHVDFGEGGYIHLCGKVCWERHAQIVLRLYDYAVARIPRYDPSVAE